MKKISLILMLFIFTFAIIHVSCNKEEEEVEENKAPEFTQAEFSLADTSATVTFSEAVYSNNDGTGNLDGSDFSISYTSPDSSENISSYYVIHLPGISAAKFQFVITTSIDGNEIVKIKPANASSIYDSEGKAMEANQEISFILE